MSSITSAEAKETTSTVSIRRDSLACAMIALIWTRFLNILVLFVARYGSIQGGFHNEVNALWAAVVGGDKNIADGESSAILGGDRCVTCESDLVLSVKAETFSLCAFMTR